MTVDLYYLRDSAPCNSIILLAHTLGIELNLIHIDLRKDEQLTEAYIKMNPEHTVPTLNDNGFVVWESRAILIYLLDKYASNDSLYPRHPEQRARVNQRLFFDLGTFYQRLADYFYPQVFEKKPADPAKLAKIDEAFELLDQYLRAQTYAAGSTLTLADYALVVSTLAYEGTGYDITRYPSVVRWFDLVKSSLAGWEKVIKNMESFKTYFVDL